MVYNSRMSNLIEGIGRAVTGGSPPDAALEHAQDVRGKDLIKQLVLGGAVIGGGTGLGVALANLVTSLNKEKELYDPAELNSNTLYVPVKRDRTKEANMLPYVAPGIALAGGTAAALGSYAAVQQLWEKIENHRRKALMEEAQNEALVAADSESRHTKSAAKLSASDAILGVPVATALLSALATGGVTMAALNKAFPTIKNPVSNRPKRVRLVTEEGHQIPVSEEVLNQVEAPDTTRNVVDYVKEAAFGDHEAAGREFSASLASRVRPKGLTAAIINLVAHRGVGGLAAVVKEAGVAVIPHVTKGWEDRRVSTRDSQLAVMALHKNAYMSEVAHGIAVQELLDAVPNVITHAIGNGDPDRMRKYANVASVMGLAARSHYLPEYAAAQPQEALQGQDAPQDNASPQDYQRALEGQSSVKEEADEGLTSDAGGSLADTGEGVDTQDDVEDDDDIDSLMTGSKRMEVR